MRRIFRLNTSGSTGEKSKTSEVIYAAIITGLVASAGAVLTWYSSQESTKQAIAQNCIQRIDNQEMKIREKTEAFLGNIADLISRGSNKKLSFDESRADAEKVIRSGFELIAYAPPEMGHSALKVTIAVQAMLNVESKTDVDLVALQSQNAMTEWPNRFFSLMEKYRDEKAKCQG
ncbi:hypothetical protein J1G35_10730 [Pseudomonas sp. SH10-3B]|uniref:hypothetical protein n=1 Tax=Pseudomonas sp. SH10-3B TaxID=2816049 RepID=UPI001CA63C99|nr:hypothetical protein [Pseudomonas sp. SH10-3B]MBY8946341.1 hypothetical protein [Pseudomonas sp. SH10-3B]